MNGEPAASRTGLALLDQTDSYARLPDGPELAKVLARQGYLAVLVTEGHGKAAAPAVGGQDLPGHRHADPDGFAVRRRMLRNLAGAISGQAPGNFRITLDEAGAPHLAGGGFHVSLSGRKPLSAVALARRPVGIDLERLVPEEGIPWNLLRTEERAALQQLPPGPRSLAFTRLWAAKEAYAKALGAGFRLAPEWLAITADGKAGLTPEAPLQGPGGQISWAERPGRKDVIIALALLSSGRQSFMDEPH